MRIAGVGVGVYNKSANYGLRNNQNQNRNYNNKTVSNPNYNQNRTPVAFKGWFEDMIFYIPNKRIDHRNNKKEKQIEQVENSVHDDVRLMAERKGIPISQAKAQYNEVFDAVSIPLKKDGNEVGLNKVVGYSAEKYQIMKDLLIPLKYKGTDKEKEYPVPNGILLYGPKNTGKTHFVKALGEHLKAKDLAKFYVFKPGEMTADDNGAEIYGFLKNSSPEHPEVLFFDDMEKYLDPEMNPEVSDTFLAMTAECAKRGITWVGSTNHPEKLSPLLFKPYRLNSDILFDKTSNAEKSAVMSYMWRQKDRRDDTDHDKLINEYNTTKFNFYPPEMQKVADMTDEYMKDNVDKDRIAGFDYRRTEKLPVKDKYVEPQIDEYIKQETLLPDEIQEDNTKTINYEDIRDEIKTKRFELKNEKPIKSNSDD